MVLGFPSNSAFKFFSQHYKLKEWHVTKFLKSHVTKLVLYMISDTGKHKIQVRTKNLWLQYLNATNPFVLVDQQASCEPGLS